MSFTQKRWKPPDVAPTWQQDRQNVVKSIVDYLQSLEARGSLSVSEASITANSGIIFPATEVPSSDPNTLDDYEEFSWTPVGNGITFSSASGFGEKIGRLVIARFDVTWPVTANASQAQLTGLPYTVANTGPAQGGFVSYTNAGTTYSAAANVNSTYGVFYDNAGNSPSNAGVSTKRLVGAFVYYVP
jgi:hypothetical protein